MNNSAEVNTQPVTVNDRFLESNSFGFGDMRNLAGNIKIWPDPKEMDKFLNKHKNLILSETLSKRVYYLNRNRYQDITDIDAMFQSLCRSSPMSPQEFCDLLPMLLDRPNEMEAEYNFSVRSRSGRDNADIYIFHVQTESGETLSIRCWFHGIPWQKKPWFSVHAYGWNHPSNSWPYGQYTYIYLQ